jgi:alkaline phosphatase
MSTYSASGHGYDGTAAWSDFDYIKSGATDSASAATAMSTGVKTYDGAIGVDLGGNDLLHLMELAEDLGKATGVVSSVEFSHATPAAFVAHNASRNNYGEIANEMLYESRCEVIMGAGHPWFDNNGEPVASPNYKYIGGEATYNDLTDADGLLGADADGDGTPDAWAYAETVQDFWSLCWGDTPERVVGVPQVYQTLQHNRDGDTQVPYATPLNDNVPSLAVMTWGALNVLDNDEDGFVLMVEGGAVDWAGHGNSMGRLIEEEVDFNLACRVVDRWVRKHSNWGETLVIVTGDHETGYLTGPNGDPEYTYVTNNGRWQVPGHEWHSGSHTNQLIPFFAKGAGANWFRKANAGWDPVRGPYVDNTSVGAVAMNLIR